MTGEDDVKLWASRARRFGPAMRNEMRRLGQRAVQLSRITMRDEIYSKPPDFTKSGRPKWIQTGNLLLSEELVEESADSFTLTNSAPYAHRRHEANKPGFPYKVNSQNPDRTAHWRDDALEKVRKEMPEAFERLQIRIFSEGSG